MGAVALTSPLRPLSSPPPADSSLPRHGHYQMFATLSVRDQSPPKPSQSSSAPRKHGKHGSSTHSHDLARESFRLLFPLLEIRPIPIQLGCVNLLLVARLGSEKPRVGLELIPPFPVSSTWCAEGLAVPSGTRARTGAGPVRAICAASAVGQRRSLRSVRNPGLEFALGTGEAAGNVRIGLEACAISLGSGRGLHARRNEESRSEATS